MQAVKAKRGIKTQIETRFWPIGLCLVAIGVVARLWNLRNAPGWEWDEVVYGNIAHNLYEGGQMVAKTEYLSQPEPYLYHPPFYFHLLARWFELVDSGVTQGRVLAVAGAAVTMLLLLALLRRVIGEAWALAGVGLIAVDTWLNFSQRVGWIENTMIPIGVLGLLLYVIALEKNRWWWYAGAGFFLGSAAVYKHIGFIFVGVLVVYAILFRENWRKNLLALGAAFLTILSYALMAMLVYGPVFVNATVVQFLRSAGEKASSGALTSLEDVISPLVGQYRIYVATVVLAALAVILVVYRLGQIIIHKGNTDKVRPIGILYAWALAAVVFFLGLQLRFPHYSMLAFIPLFCYLVAEVSMIRLTARRSIAIGVVGVLVLVANIFAFNARFVSPEHDSALRDVQQFATTNMPLDAKVIADESTGTVIPQPFCVMWRGASCTGATYIIVYTSSTQHLENNYGQQELIDSGTEVFSTTGYKETIVIYQLAEAIP